MTASIAHRGPDQEGVYESAAVSLGAVRLKIIDLDGGDQPVVSDDGTTVIVFNGEVYNHAELRRQLEQKGHRFHSHCDTEVVLHAFMEWGTDCFARLRGMFGLALWSEPQRRLVLARDRMGIKPLYFRLAGSEICFGSEVKVILEHPATRRELDAQALDDYLSLNYVPGPRTLVKGIEKVPPGHWLEWKGGKARLEQYWDLRFRPDRKLSEEAALEQLDGLLQSAVREHMVSDVPLGVWSSGGIDSSTILHYAAAASPSRLKTFSVSFAGRSFDESPWFREVASVYGTDHHEFDLNPEVELQDAIQEFAYYSDEPTADAGALPVWFLSRMSRRHVTVALSGDGGDELFGGYVTYIADRLAQPLRLVPRVLRAAAARAAERLVPVSDDKISFEYKLKRLLRGSTLPPDEAHFFWNGTCSEAQRRQLSRSAVAGNLGRWIAGLDGSRIGYLNRYLYLDQHFYLPDDILMKVDRMSMAHSLEVRPPLLDHRVVEFAAGLPQRLKIRGLTQKYLLKRLMKGRLPGSVLHRKKMGFDVPAHDWFRGPLRDLLLDTLSGRAVAATEVFDPAGVNALIRDHLERRANVGYHLWGLLILFLWMRRWGIEASIPGDLAEPLPVRASVAS